MKKLIFSAVAIAAFLAVPAKAQKALEMVIRSRKFHSQA